MERTRYAGFLFLFVSLLLCGCFLLAGCGAGQGAASSGLLPQLPPQNLIKIIAPSGGVTVDAAAPIEISVQFSQGADPKAMRALLDGIDISSLFAIADSGGVRTAKVDHSKLNLGKNQIQVTSGTQQANSMFWVSYAKANAPGVSDGASEGMPLLVPIKTRVLLSGDGSNASDWGISLYEDPDDPTKATNIQAPSGSGSGFQVVMLRRSDLSLQLNTTAADSYDAINLQTALAKIPAGCGEAGCLIIVQSLQTIGSNDTPCYSLSTTPNNVQTCPTVVPFLDNIGATGRLAFANGNNPQVAYSFIGNSSSQSVPAGTWYERLTCSGNNYGDGGGPPCDSLGYPNTSYTAAKDGPMGRMSGAFIRDNYGNYTYTQTAPVISFHTASDDQALTNTVTVEGVEYASSPLPSGSKGGFHLVVLNRNTLAEEENLTYSAGNTGPMIAKIGSYSSYGNLFFIASFGDVENLNKTFSTQYQQYQDSLTMEKLGGTQQVFFLLDYNGLGGEGGGKYGEPTPTTSADSYTLVGAFSPQPIRIATAPYSVTTGPATPQYGAEVSSVISRETYVSPPKNSDMEGYLELDHEGYYSPKVFGPKIGMSNAVNAEAASASLKDPVAWPFPGPDPAKSRAAYDWISQQLCCTDIRSTYPNLNTTPSIWLDKLESLSYDPKQLPGSDEQDFDAMKQQLYTEFQYVALVRNFQGNLLGLYQDQQEDIGLLLQQSSDQVTANLQVDLNTPAHKASWLGIVGQSFGVVGAASGFLDLAGPAGTGVAAGINTAMALGTLGLTIAGNYTNSAAGTSLQAQEAEETTAGQMAGETANEYASTLVSLGNEFNRIVGNWGRLKTLGAPLLAGQIPWDENASGYLLRAYDRVVRRQFLTKLLKTSSTAIYYPTVAKWAIFEDYYYNGHHLCLTPTLFSPQVVAGTAGYSTPEYWIPPDLPLLFYPNGLNLNPSPNLPSYGWGLWALVFNQHTTDDCPTSHAQPKTFGLFKPIDPNNPEALGDYRLWWFTRKMAHDTIQNDSVSGP